MSSLSPFTKPVVLEIDRVKTSSNTTVVFDDIQSNLDNAVSGIIGSATTNYDDLGKVEAAITTVQSDISTNYATQTYVTTEINTLRSDILGGASTAYDTLQEIEAYLGNNDTDITNIVNTMATKAPLPASATTAGQVLTWTGTAFFNDPQPITDLNALITTNANDIATLQTNQGTLTTALNANTTNIATNTTDIATLTTDLATAEADILNNTGNITTNTSDISTLQSDLATANTTIANHTTRLTTNESNITTLQTDVATNASGIAVNVNDISTLQTDLSTANSNITTLQSDVSTNASDISTLQSDVSALNSTVSTHTSNFVTVTNSLNAKAPTPPTQVNTGDFLYFDGTSFQYGTPPSGGGSSSTVSGGGGIVLGYAYDNSTVAESFSTMGQSSAVIELTTTGADSAFHFSFNGTVTINGMADIAVYYRVDQGTGTWTAWENTNNAKRSFQNDGWGVLKTSAHSFTGIHRPTVQGSLSSLPIGWKIQYTIFVDTNAGTIYFPMDGQSISATLIELAA